jgi:hypothetical protein
MKPEFVLLHMVNWNPKAEGCLQPEGKEIISLRNDDNLTKSLRIHIRMMCEEYAQSPYESELPKKMLNAINKYEFCTFKRGFEYSNGLTHNHIEVICEYKTTSDIL